MSYFRDQLESWLATIEVDASRVLDVGAGTNPARKRARVDCEEYVTLDHRDEAEPDIVGDLNEPLELDGSFDAVFCLEVFEYVWNPVEAHRNLARALRPGGVLYVSYPFVYPIHEPAGLDYLRYTEDGVRKLLDVAGFDVKTLQPRLATRGRTLRGFYRREGMYVRDPDSALHIGYLARATRHGQSLDG